MSHPEQKGPKIIGFLCEWSAAFDHMLEEDGSTMKGMPNVQILKIPCSGMVKPEWVQLAMQKGAKGVFVCGCPTLDCHYREGNIFIRDRLVRERQPFLRPKGIDPTRVRAWWFNALETQKLIDEIKKLEEEILQSEREKEKKTVSEKEPAAT